MFNLFGKKMPNNIDEPIKLNPELVVPRIKHLNFLDALKPMLASVEDKGGNSKEQTLVTKPLIGDLIVSYAIDLPEAFRFLNFKDLKELDFNLEELHELSLNNLDRECSEVYEQDLVVYKTIVTGKHLEACTILFPSLWSSLSEDLQEKELFVVIPSRDVVYFMGANHNVEVEGTKLDNEKCFDLMCSAALDVIKNETTHALSNYVYCWRDGKWFTEGLLGKKTLIC